MLENVEIDPCIRVRDASLLLLGPVVIRVTAFDEATVEDFSEQVTTAHQTGQTFLPIIIDSFGGDAYALMSMIDILKTSQLPIATIVEGKAMSCGAALFTCGAQGWRFIGPNATLMFHDVSLEGAGGKSEEVKIVSKETDRLNKRMWRLMEKNIGQPAGYLSNMVHERGRTDWYMSPKEAIKHNIANHIRIPKLVTNVTVETSLV